MKRKKLIVKLALGLLAVLLLCTFLSRTVNNLLLPEVTTALVEQTTVPRTTYAAGTLGIEGQQEVRAGKNWVVDEVLVEPGDKVREGDPLFTLELEDYTDQLEAAQDSLDLLLEELSS